MTPPSVFIPPTPVVTHRLGVCATELQFNSQTCQRIVTLHPRRTRRTRTYVRATASSHSSAAAEDESIDSPVDAGPTSGDDISLDEFFASSATIDGIPDDNDNDKDDVLFDGIDDEQLVSDDTHVVIDGADVAHLIEQLRVSGDDDLSVDTSSSSSSEAVQTEQQHAAKVQSSFLKAAEQLADVREGRRAPSSTDASTTASTTVSPSPPSLETRPEPGADADDVMDMKPMEYFVSENVSFMPSWVRTMYESNTHDQLVEGADRLAPDPTRHCLNDILSRRRASAHESSRGDGIVDCTVQDVATDYSVPIEFIVDAMLSIGVPIPISGSLSVRDSMTTEEIERLLKVLTSFDAVDLSERYSDRTIGELADDYDCDFEDVIAVCEKEGLYAFAGKDTHLSTVREDRVMDILLKGEPFGKPYPPLMDGLE